MSLVETQEEGQQAAGADGSIGQPTGPQPPVVAVRRRTIDAVLVGAGTVITIVLAVAGSLLTWGSNFASDYVSKELSSQNIFFPDKAALQEEGRTDLFGFAGQQVTSGTDAQAYASTSPTIWRASPMAPPMPTSVLRSGPPTPRCRPRRTPARARPQ